jgi:hypothetical protein
MAFWLLGNITVLTACKTMPDVRNMPSGKYKTSVKNVPYAAASPIRDLNIKNPDVPEELAKVENPYALPARLSCASLLEEVYELEEAISENSPGTVGSLHANKTRAGNLGNAADATTKAIASSLIPFRGVVRLASGATYKAKRKRKADQLGRERIGFLVGVGSARRCPGFTIDVPKLR